MSETQASLDQGKILDNSAQVNQSIWEFAGTDDATFTGIAQRAIRIFATEVAMKSPGNAGNAEIIQEIYLEDDVNPWELDEDTFHMTESGQNDIVIDRRRRKVKFLPHNSRGQEIDDQLLHSAIDQFDAYLHEQNITSQRKRYITERKGYKVTEVK